MINELLEKGLQKHRAGHPDEAESFYEQALAMQPDHPDALHLAGVAALQRGAAARGAARIEQAVRRQPENPAFHANLAQAYLALERVADAHAAFQRAAALNPSDPQFAVGVANCLALQGRLAEAEQQLRGVTQRHPRLALAWFNLARTVHDQGRPEEAAAHYRRTLELEPGSADAHNGLGRALHALERFEEAERAYRRHLDLQPESVQGHCNLASVLIDCGRFAEAESSCRGAVARAPESVELRLMQGAAQVYQGRIAAALETYAHALRLAPRNARAAWGYGYALVDSGRGEEGLAFLEAALDQQQGTPEFRESLSMVLLSLGDVQPAWIHLESRSARRRFLAGNPGVVLADELPGDLRGKRIVVLREQGLGDDLFFLRYAALLGSGGADIACQAHERLASILARVPELGRILPDNEPPPAADAVFLMADLPRRFGRCESSSLPSHGTPRRAPAGTPPIRRFARSLRVFYPELPPPLKLAALPPQIEEAKRRLAELGPPPYRGVTWRAGTAPAEQRGTEWALHKEIGIEDLGAALRDVDGTWVALQRNPKPGEIERLSSSAGRPVHDFSAFNENLESMLALVVLLDEYVGVSNTNMHLRAGAGGKARVLVPRPAEWRWMTTGHESPWFPGFRVYRQGMDGSWTGALATLRADLLAAQRAGGGF